MTRAAAVATLLLARCNQPSDSALQKTGGAILEREMPANIDQVTFDTSELRLGLAGVRQNCAVHFTGEARKGWLLLPDPDYIDTAYGPGCHILAEAKNLPVNRGGASDTKCSCYADAASGVMTSSAGSAAGAISGFASA
jgi:hypothetical protein